MISKCFVIVVFVVSPSFTMNSFMRVYDACGNRKYASLKQDQSRKQKEERKEKNESRRKTKKRDGNGERLRRKTEDERR